MGKKLYKVTLRGMHGTFCEPAHGIAYIVADDPDEAVVKLQEDLKKRDIGTEADREMDTVELIAECEDYPFCGYKLYI